MAVFRKSKLTKLEIIKTATSMFLEVGYSKTSPQMIAKELGISTGNLTYYYPTKEHLLEVLVEMLCDFQIKLLEYEAKEGMDSTMSVCIELMTVAAACEDSEVAKDFFVSTFQSQKCLDYICKSHIARSKKIFAEQCKGWTDEQFAEAEILILGIDYAAIISTNAPLAFDVRIGGALNQILSIYNVPEEIRNEKIKKVQSMNYRAIGKRIFKEFKEYIEQENEQAFDELLK